MDAAGTAPGTKFYVIRISGGLSATAYGPFATEADQFRQAKSAFADHNTQDDGVFGLAILPDGTPLTRVYSSDAFAEGD